MQTLMSDVCHLAATVAAPALPVGLVRPGPGLDHIARAAGGVVAAPRVRTVPRHVPREPARAARHVAELAAVHAALLVEKVRLKTVLKLLNSSCL